MLKYPVLLFALLCTSSPLCGDDEETKTRDLRFLYRASVEQLDTGAKVKVWIPIPQSNDFQDVELIVNSLPSPLQVAKEPKFGNQIGYFEFTMEQAGQMPFGLEYKIRRREARSPKRQKALSSTEREQFLSRNKLVPVSGAPLELLEGKSLSTEPLELGHELYNIVESYMAYDKSKPGYGNGDVLWACSSRTGNCTDFHSLFISLARSRGLPARFEIGFPIAKAKAGKIGGYHCWAWFHTKKQGWVPVDISEADKHPELKRYYFGSLTADRVAFSVGRDIELVPASESGPLNYFVYPHIEVDGKVWPTKKIGLDFSYRQADEPTQD